MKRHRGYFFVSFAVSHLFHAAAILTLVLVTAGAALEDNTWIDLVLGGLVYVLILTMAATSVDRAAGLLARRGWRRLHTSGAYVILVVFLLGFGLRVPESKLYVPLTLLPLLAMALRLTTSVRLKQVASS